MHEADEPNAILDLFDSDHLAGKDVAQIDLAAFETDPAAVRHHGAPVVKRILEIVEAAVETR